MATLTALCLMTRTPLEGVGPVSPHKREQIDGRGFDPLPTPHRAAAYCRLEGVRHFYAAVHFSQRSR